MCCTTESPANRARAGFVIDSQANALTSCTFSDDDVHYHGTIDLNVSTTLPSGQVVFTMSTTAVGEILCTYIFKASTDPEVAGMFMGLYSFFYFILVMVWFGMINCCLFFGLCGLIFPCCRGDGDNSGCAGGCGGGGGGCGGGGCGGGG